MDLMANTVQYTFFGKVYPERCNVSIPEFRLRVDTPSDEIHGELKYSISLSQVTATFVCEKPIVNILTLKNCVEDAIRVGLDTLGYILACGYDFEVIVMTNSLGNGPVVFGVGIPVIEKEASNAGISFEVIMELFKDAKGRYLQNCLANLREAIRVPKDTGFFCYRALKSLRQFFIHEKGASDKESSWEMFRSELNVDRADIDGVKALADPVRHGAGVGISDAQRAKTFMLVWAIIIKYIKYGSAGYKKS